MAALGISPAWWARVGSLTEGGVSIEIVSGQPPLTVDVFRPDATLNPQRGRASRFGSVPITCAGCPKQGPRRPALTSLERKLA